MADDGQKNNVAKTEATIIHESEEDRLRRDIYRSDEEKLQLFVQMLQINKLFSKAVVIHK